MRRRRPLALAVLIGVTGPLMVACTPPDAGVAGMTLDAAGRPTAVVAWCPGKAPDTIIVYADGDDLDSERTITLKAPGRFPGRTIQVPITDPPAGWTADPPAPSLDPRLVYHVYAPVTGSDHTARGPTFTLGRLRGDGLILQNRYDENTDEYVDVYVGMDDLIREADGLC